MQRSDEHNQFFSTQQKETETPSPRDVTMPIPYWGIGIGRYWWY